MKIEPSLSSLISRLLLAAALLLAENVVSTTAGSTTSTPVVKPMLMTTEMPDGVATPNVMETETLGTLTSFDGVPDLETTQKVFDNLDLQRATQAFLNTLQIASLTAMERGFAQFGPPTTTVLLFEELVDPRSLLLTANTVSVYMMMWLELPQGGGDDNADEPMVMETPSNVLGFINDAWFQYVADFGNAGPDNGMGGKFLIIPPGYQGEIPTTDEDGEEYHIAKTSTYGNWVIWRGFQVDGSTEQAITECKEKFKIYPLSMAAEAPNNMTFVNVSGESFNTIHRMDFGFWEELNEPIQAEPLEGLDPEVRGQLASIGIEKGKTFAPDERMTRILTEAANVGSVTARALTARPKDERLYLYPGERTWTNPFVDGRHDFLLDGARLLDSRAYFHFYATGITPAMSAKNIGTGSQYGITYLDSNGNGLDGSKTYKLNLPKDIPAQDFWSVNIYDSQTRSMLQTDQQFPGLSSSSSATTSPPEPNEDGSYDIYFGPSAPPDGIKENNWLQTIPGKGWNMVFRLYGPLQAFYDQTWMPGDPELVDDGNASSVAVLAEEEKEGDDGEGPGSSLATSTSSASSYSRNGQFSYRTLVAAAASVAALVIWFP